MDAKSYDEIRNHLASHWERFPSWKDAVAVLDWAADKPGSEAGWAEIARIIGGDGATMKTEGIAQRALTSIAILTAGPVQIAEPFFKVRSANGGLYPVEGVGREVWDGGQPFVLEATGETIDDFAANAVPFIRFYKFTSPDNGISSPKM